MIIGADLYSGLGGFTEGAEQAGVYVTMAANHWAAAIEWHSANHRFVHHEQQDIAQMDMRLLPDLRDGILLAAPACQGCSSAGQPARAGRGGSHRPDAGRIAKKHDADRNTTWAVLAAADTARPRTIVVENVPMLLKWQLFPAWCDVLRAMGYAVTTQVLDASRFGSAQQRRRLIIVASQDGELHLDQGAKSAASSIASCLQPDEDAEHRWEPIASKPERMRRLIAKAQRQAGERCFWNNVSESRGRRLDECFPTLTTRSESQFNLIDGDRVRVLNPRELARAQSFPDHYLLPDERGLAGKLIGNAIDVRMARAVVEQVVAHAA